MCLTGTGACTVIFVYVGREKKKILGLSKKSQSALA
jgi:hypothetical protein